MKSNEAKPPVTVIFVRGLFMNFVPSLFLFQTMAAGVDVLVSELFS
jgi:hypothetical protein